jgi:hypothetical protein
MQKRKPAWWQLIMLVSIMFGLMVVEHLAPLPGISDQLVDAGIVALAFVGMLVWVHLNGGLLEWYYMEKDGAIPWLKITVYEPVSKTQDDGADSHEATPLSAPRAPIKTRKPRVQSKGKDKWFLN